MVKNAKLREKRAKHFFFDKLWESGESVAPGGPPKPLKL